MAFNRVMNYTLAASRKPITHTGEPHGDPCTITASDGTTTQGEMKNGECVIPNAVSGRVDVKDTGSWKIVKLGNKFGEWLELWDSRDAYDPADPDDTGVLKRISKLGGDVVRVGLGTLCEARRAPARNIIRPIERRLGQSLLPDAIKYEASCFGLSIGIQQTRDGDVNLSTTGGIDPKSLFVDIPAKSKPGVSFSLRAEKILRNGVISTEARRDVLRGYSMGFSAGYKVYGAVDVTPRDVILGVGAGVGINIGGSNTTNLFETCNEW